LFDEQIAAKNFLATFGKKFDRKAFAKLVSSRLKTKEEEYCMNLVSHLSTEQLINLREQLKHDHKTNANS
jgi:hypothetical protein